MQNINNTQDSQFNYLPKALTDNTVNQNGILTYTMFRSLVDLGTPKVLLDLFWISPKRITLPSNDGQWIEGVYVYSKLNPYTIVLSTPVLEVTVSDKFYVNLKPSDVIETAVINGLLPILRAMSKLTNFDSLVAGAKLFDCDISGWDISGIEKNGKSIFGNIVPTPSSSMELVAAPKAKSVATRDPSKLPHRESQGWRKSYGEIREILEDYILDETDFAVLPVMNADLLNYLKLEGGTYVDPLSEIELTYTGHTLIACGDKWKMEFNAKIRNGMYAVYGLVSSIDERYTDDLHEVSKVIHALSNLYKLHKKSK